jgi:Fe2+ or Zn2+ uptake regulation protein
VKTPDELVEHFRAQDLKVTPQRELLFRLIHGNEGHPTAEAIYADARRLMPTMSLKTVYQTLNDLTDMGELQHLDLGTGAGRYDPNIGDHHHLVCTSCGKVRDVHATFDALQLSADDRQGFSLGGADIVFRGLCASCQAHPAPAGSPVAPAG